jgi:hypothetical protein
VLTEKWEGFQAVAFKIIDGRIIFTQTGRYKLTLTLTKASMSSAWQVVGISILVQPHVDELLEGGVPLKRLETVGKENLQNFAQSHADVPILTKLLSICAHAANTALVSLFFPCDC